MLPLLAKEHGKNLKNGIFQNSGLIIIMKLFFIWNIYNYKKYRDILSSSNLHLGMYLQNTFNVMNYLRF
jgi:hypothetical protein